MQETRTTSRRGWKRRLTALVLAAVMVMGLVPGFPGAGGTASAHWAEPYLSQLVEWGFIRADQAQNPDRALTRADFMAITNRAYGYSTPGETPFEDIKESDWFYDDVGIAYNARYIKGTSPTTASPNDPLTRETSATILGRNMMLQESAGEILAFTDARQISNWAKGTIKSSLEHYLVSGYDDGTFRPQRNVSWGEMASMVTKIIGTPLQEPGDYSLGGTFGNVTITSPGVTLRDTTISGDLYVTGGVGLGDVKLENVTVLGRIIASGTGNSEGGEASILLRNVTADEMLIDNLQDDYVSVKADGITEIGRTTVRTSAYIEDNTPDGLGLKYISIEGETYPEGEEPEDWEPIQVDLAGRIEEVVNRTPQSQVRAGRGTVAKLTVDEAAVDSTVIIDRGAVVKELNLDTATIVTGEGDIEHLVVNAPGCEVEMLPDKIDIRPGITAIIAGEEMDTVAAEESSQEPLILAGYPKAQDITPTGLEAVFMTNKSGTVYWAVSAITDGSVGEDDLIKPPSYGSIAVAHGSVNAPKGNEEFISMVSRLTPGGEYYLSAILVDARDHRSPVKVISFSTPDNTVPTFCAGYPHMSNTSPKNAIAVAMPTKDCKLYYALLPEGAVAPTANELKTNAVSGALGYGVMDVYKNKESTFQINDTILEERANYVVYFLLTDGVNSSPVTPLRFTTKDETPPEFIMGPEITDVKANAVGLTFQINEDGVVYWVAVPAGTVYPKPQPGTDYDTAPLNSDYAKLQVMNGMNLGTDGKAGRVNAKEATDGKINVSGLKPESAYDLYYLAVDKAGNRGLVVGKMTINTLDNTGPKFSQSFSKTSGTDDTVDPLASTDIYLDVTENIRYSGKGGGPSFLDMYNEGVNGNAASAAKLVDNLSKSIKLHKVDADTGEDTDVAIDYSKVTITARNKGIRITIPNDAVTLENGAEYYFTIQDITDTSNNFNPLAKDNPDFVVDFRHNEAASKGAGHNVPVFMIEFARVWFTDNRVPKDLPGANADQPIDLFFRLRPEGTKNTASDISYDILLWSDTIISYDLYYRVVDTDLNPTKETMFPGSPNPNPQTPNASGWVYLGNAESVPGRGVKWSGNSVNKDFNEYDASNFPALNTLDEIKRYEFAISLTSYKGETDRTLWNGDLTMQANIAAGQSNRLDLLAGLLKDTKRWESDVKARTIRSIGRWNNAETNPDTFVMEWGRTDTGIPNFFEGFPDFDTTSNSVDMSLALTSAGYVHYAISKVNKATGRPLATATRRLTDSEIAAIAGKDENVDYSDKNATPPEVFVTINPPEGLQPMTEGGLERIPEWMRGKDPAGQDTSKDFPAGKNEIIIPTSLHVARPTTWPGNIANQLVDYDTVEVGTNQENVTIDKLEPNTDYVAYFVIENKSEDRSHVYMYKFTTPEVSKPRIKPSQEGDANVKMDIDVATNGYYRMLSEDSALKGMVTILAKLLKDYTLCKGTNPSTNDPEAVDKKLPVKYEDYTLLQALLEDYNFGEASGGDPAAGTATSDYYYATGSRYNEGVSVFDVYADSNARSHVFRVIQQRTDSNGESVDKGTLWGPSGSTSTKAPGKDEEWAETMLKNLDIQDFPYIFLTYAINKDVKTTSGNGHLYASFHAARVQRSSLKAPEVDKSNTLGSMTSDNSPLNTYSGAITVAFDQDIFFKSGDRVTTGNLFDGYAGYDPGAADYPGKVSFIPSNATFAKASSVTARSFTLELTGMRVGNAVQFPTMYFRNRTDGYANKALIITLEEDARNDKRYLVVRWGGVEQVRIPVQEAAVVEVALLVQGTGGTLANPTLTFENTDSPAKPLTAQLTPSDGLADVTYTWSVKNPSIVDVQPKDQAQVTVSPKAVGTTTIDLIVMGRDTNGTMKTLTKSIEVSVGGTLTLNSAATSDTAEGGKAEVSGTDVTWTIKNGTPTLTLTFTSSSSLLPSSVTVTSNPADALTGITKTFTDTDNKALTVTAKLSQIPKKKVVTLTVSTGGGSYPITISFPESVSQSGIPGNLTTIDTGSIGKK